jgi:hypothetical protein
MDAKELTKHSHEQDVDISHLKVKVHDLEMTILVLEQKVKDLQCLEHACDVLSKRVQFLENNR